MRFVLLDQLIRIDRGHRAQARAHFAATLPLFADHFPGQPIVPGVLLTETMCQTAGWLIAATCDFSGWPLVVRIDRANFRRIVHADEPLEIAATLTASRDETFEIQATTQVASDVVADARLLFRLFRFDMTSERSSALEAWGRDTFAQLGGPSALAERDR